MKATRVYLLLHLLLSAGVLVHSFEPVTMTLFGCGFGLAAVGGSIYQYLHESCSPRWIPFNPRGLQADLETKLFGQHIASGIILKAVTGFMRNDNPKSPLVLSLHGTSGTGKNLVSQMIADNIYKKGRKSSFVHMFMAEFHFPHKSQIETYKAQLQDWIKGNVTNCARSMFIFDEMDKMHPGLIDSIKPYLEYYESVDGVSYRKAIFIFLSNAGGESITQTALDFWKAGRDREELKLSDLEEGISLSVFNNKNNGLWHTSLIDKGLMGLFVPFLPLEHQHVVQCAMAEMKAKNLPADPAVADQVARNVVYFPKTERIFSVKGCKAIASKLDYFYK